MTQVITLIVIATLVAIDQIIKLLVIEYLEPIGTLKLINGFIQLNYTENTGAAFGSFSKYTTILSVVTAVILIAGIVVILSGIIKNNFEKICVILIIAGGFGNLIDRIFRGFVVDYIEPLFVDFAIFNFADMLITCGAILLIVWLLIDIFKDVKNKKVSKNE